MLRLSALAALSAWLVLAACGLSAPAAFAEEAAATAEPSGAEAALHDERPLVRLGYLQAIASYESTTYLPGDEDLVKGVVAYLQAALPALRFEAASYSLPGLAKAVERQEVDFSMMSAGQFVELMPAGAYAIASLYTPRYPNPNRIAGALFVARADDDRLRTIADMKDTRAVFNSRSNYINYQIPMAEIAAAGFDPDRFFSSASFTNDQPPQILEALLAGRADVGVFRVCELEALEERYPEYRGRFRAVGEQASRPGACRRSTALYPGWTVAVSAGVPPETTRLILAALLEKKPGPGSQFGWSVATEFNRVNEVFRLIKAGPYAHLREWTVRRIAQEFWPFILLALGGACGWVVHWLRVEQLAQRRAQELAAAYLKERELEEKAEAVEARLQAMSRLGVVSQLSSIFAHEMGQPLAAIGYRARGIETLLAHSAPKPKILEALAVIRDQTARAGLILQKVRAYAKGKTSRQSLVRFDLTVQNVLLELARSERHREPSSAEIARCTVRGDALELHLAVLNILRNAFEAAEAEGKPRGVRLRLSAEGSAGPSERAALEVENAGRRLAEKELAEYLQPISSRKAEGIGLGVLITSSIAEAHGGSFTLRPLPAGGARALLQLPLAPKDSAGSSEAGGHASSSGPGA